LTQRELSLSAFRIIVLIDSYEESGVIVFNVLSGRLAKKGRLEVCLDDGYWPCFTTIKSRSNNAQWETVGEGFIKELDFGRVWLRLNEADEGEKDSVIAEWKGDAKAFLHSTLVRFYFILFHSSV
jgi:Ca2+-dependent lipid-binding protein